MSATDPFPPLSPELAARFASLAVDNLAREYPNAPAHLLTGPGALQPPRHLHPAFFGSYDWHSCVHQHWLLVRLMRLGLPEGVGARGALDATLTTENLAAEAAYLEANPTFERTYGWAWLLRLAEELLTWDDADARRWSANLQPLCRVVVSAWAEFLPRTAFPVRAGTHANSAFALALAIDYARTADERSFESACRAKAVAWFAADADYPAALEPSGDDFLSGALTEAALMTRLLNGEQFAAWLATFLPSPPRQILAPVTTADRSDPKLVHLDGLNLSRAWCWRRVAASLPGSDPRRELALSAAAAHADSALPHVFSGEYVGEHWLASFAALMLTDR
jgi:DUF2891 family protein